MSGLEILAVAAGVLQIAELGGNLSVKLFTFMRKIKNADRNIDRISQDIAATGAVLQQLGTELKKDEKLRLCSPEAIATAKSLMEDCHKIFKELNDAVDGKGKALGSGAKVVLGLKQRLKYPFLEPQIELLKANLEKLKSSLLVMLNVLIFAEQLKNQEALPILKDQRELLKSLVEEKAASQKQYDQILKRLDQLTVESDDASILSTSKASSSATDSNITLIGTASNPTKAPAMIDEYTPLSSLPAHLHHRAEELFDHCRLINAVIQEVNDAQYRIDLGIRYRTQELILDSHYNEWVREVVSGEVSSQQPAQTKYEFLQNCPELKRYWLRKDSENKPPLHGSVPHHHAALYQQMRQQDMMRLSAQQQQQQNSSPASTNPYMATAARHTDSHALSDHQMRILLLEQQNKRRLVAARQQVMLQSKAATIGREMYAQSAAEFHYSQPPSVPSPSRSTGQAAAKSPPGPQPHYVSAKRSSSPPKQYDPSKRSRSEMPSYESDESFRPQGGRPRPSQTSPLTGAAPTVLSPSDTPGVRRQESSCDSCVETKIPCGGQRPRCTQCNLRGQECKYPVFLSSPEPEMAGVVEMPAATVNESTPEPFSPAYSPARRSGEVDEKGNEDSGEEANPTEQKIKPARGRQSLSNSSSTVAGTVTFGTDQTLNLDFSPLDDEDVLENFDFDSFLNAKYEPVPFDFDLPTSPAKAEAGDHLDLNTGHERSREEKKPEIPTRKPDPRRSLRQQRRKLEEIKGKRIQRMSANTTDNPGPISGEGDGQVASLVAELSEPQTPPRPLWTGRDEDARGNGSDGAQGKSFGMTGRSAAWIPQETTWAQAATSEEEDKNSISVAGRYAQMEVEEDADLGNVFPPIGGAANGRFLQGTEHRDTKARSSVKGAGGGVDMGEGDIEGRHEAAVDVDVEMIKMVEMMERYTTLEHKELVWIMVDVM